MCTCPICAYLVAVRFSVKDFQGNGRHCALAMLDATFDKEIKTSTNCLFNRTRALSLLCGEQFCETFCLR